MTAKAELEMWVVYAAPADMPHVEYMARRWVAKATGATPTDDTVTGPLEELRPLFRERGYTWMDRRPDDDPVIVEVWL